MASQPFKASPPQPMPAAAGASSSAAPSSAAATSSSSAASRSQLPPSSLPACIFTVDRPPPSSLRKQQRTQPKRQPQSQFPRPHGSTPIPPRRPQPSASSSAPVAPPVHVSLRGLHVSTSAAHEASSGRLSSDWLKIAFASAPSAAGPSAPVLFSSSLRPPSELDPVTLPSPTPFAAPASSSAPSSAPETPTAPASVTPSAPPANPWGRAKAWTQLDAVKKAGGGLTIYSGSATPSADSSPATTSTAATSQSSLSRRTKTASAAALEASLDQAASNPIAAPVMPRGLINTGNMCFANSILQALVHCAPFANLFRSPELKSGPFARAQSLALFPSLGAGSEPPALAGPSAAMLVRAMVDFVGQFQFQRGIPSDEETASTEPFVPTGVYDAMGQSARPALRAMQHGTTQQDAEEFLNLLLDALHEELVYATTTSEASDGSNSASVVPPVANGQASGHHRSSSANTPPLSSPSKPVFSPPKQAEWQAVTTSKAKPARTLATGPTTTQGPKRGPSAAQVAQTFSAAYHSVGRTSSGPLVASGGAESTLSPILRLFGGMTRSTLRYTTTVGTPGAAAGAGHMRQRESVTREAFLTLPVHIADPSVERIEDALAQLSHVEEMGTTETTQGQTTKITKQVQLEQLPAVLLVQLKRFVYDPRLGTPQKLEKEVAFSEHLHVPQSTLVGAAKTQAYSLTGRSYRLFAVIYHHGANASAGHYTVDVLRPAYAAPPGGKAEEPQDSWVHIDDTTLVPITGQAVVGTKIESSTGSPAPVRGHDGTPYLLLYMREPASRSAR